MYRYFCKNLFQNRDFILKNTFGLLTINRYSNNNIIPSYNSYSSLLSSSTSLNNFTKFKKNKYALIENNNSNNKIERYNINVFKWYEKNSKTEEQKSLKRELDRGGPMSRSNFVKKNPDGKLFQSAKIPIKEKVKFPKTIKTGKVWYDLNGNAIDLDEILDNTPQPILLIISIKKLFTERFINSWKEPFEKEFPNIKVLEIILEEQVINYITSPLYRFLYQRSLNFDKEKYENVLRYFGQCRSFKEELGCNNEYIPFIYLIGPQRTIVFQGTGKAYDNELKALYSTTKEISKYSTSSFI
eukprot:TRINITY_DN15953_c0_g1_i1.p1 TRINITY_DN15953_c0_g1~~TRINITY_DN15953_c0_g1_i1.p1  ORF type:complete len:299 (+),score=72.38 TRINITY_DN15953_c0_g1_i1:52-948(+)